MLPLIKNEHPRLYINTEKINYLKNLITNDPFLSKLADALSKNADEMIQQSPTEFKIIGPRMLKNCQQILTRVTTLNIAFLLSDNKKYVERSKQELFTAAEYPHWNKDHFLDTAELCTAFGISYDWLHHELSENDRAIIKNALINKGLEPGLNEQKNGWWIEHKYNWNQVGHGGLLIGALALADEEPELCEKIIHNSINYLPIAFHTYSPDGGWKGGPEYWEYTTKYSVFIMDALKTALNNDFGLSKTAGLNTAGLFPIHAAGPTDLYFNFADADPEHKSKPEYFWLGNEYHSEICINENHRLLQKKLKHNEPPTAFDIIWYQPYAENVKSLPKTALFKEVNAFFMRSKWNDPNAFFIGFKGGDNQADHAHLDLGSFVLDAMGERWAFDLGRDDYDLPGYWDFKEGGERWQYFCLNNRSHNTLTINDDIQRAKAVAPIVKHSSSKEKSFAIADLTKAYFPHTKSVLRGIALIDGKTIVIQDEIVWSGKEKKLCWNLMTDAEITLTGKEAILKKAGKMLYAKILSPIDVEFSCSSAERKPPEKQNADYQQLSIKFTEKLETTTLCVVLSSKLKERLDLISLQDWNL